MADATFLYDFNSPYAYLAARRVDEVLDGRARWQPIAFGALLMQTGRVPWSFTDERPAGVAECERRGRGGGGPPPGWAGGGAEGSQPPAPPGAGAGAAEPR